MPDDLDMLGGNMPDLEPEPPDELSDDSLTEDVDFRQMLENFAGAYFQKFSGPITCRIETYDPTRGVADATPQVILKIEGLTVTTAPVLRSVPVAFPGGALTSITWPLQSGDPVFLVPQDADFSAYFASGTINQPPGSDRKFSLSDCVLVPVAPRSLANPLPSTAYAADGTVLAGLTYAGGSDATDFAAMAAKVLAELEKIETAFNGHVHDAGSYSNSGGPVTGTSGAGPTYSSASVASTQLKVK